MRSALEHLVQVLHQDLEKRHAEGDVEQRLVSLERGMAQWEAEMEGAMMKAESKFKAARAAEERTRHAQRVADRDAESEEDEDALPDFEWPEGVVPGRHAHGGPEDGMQPLSGGMANPRGEKELLRARKLGLL